MIYPEPTSDDFVHSLDNLRSKLRADAGAADLLHLKKIRHWTSLCGIFGLMTAWIVPNYLSAFLIGLFKTATWTMSAHHILHRGYDKIPGIPHRLTSHGFAKGWRRWIDWPDWIWPKAWVHEHNTLHHYHLSEQEDPDLVENNLQWLRDKKWPVWLKYVLIILMSGMWKFIYYAPNTLRTWLIKTYPEREIPTYGSFSFWQPFSFTGRKLWWYCYLPYISFNFILIPAPFLLISPRAALYVLLNMLLAELFTNLHTFAIIVTNHAGDDLPRFDHGITTKKDFYIRQISGSVNFLSGDEYEDFNSGYLNYQIEHHLWPDMTMLQYKKAQPQVEAIAHQYGIPYIQESVTKRYWKTLAIMTGRKSMIKANDKSQPLAVGS